MGQYLNDSAGAAEALRQDGCFVLRAKLDAAFLSGLHAKAAEFFERARGGRSDEEFAEVMGLPVSHISGHLNGARTKGVTHHSVLSRYIYGDTERLGIELAKQLAKRELVCMMEDILGPDVFLHTNNLAVRFRKQSAPEINLPFHQDSFYWREPEFLADGRPVMLVLWAPFTDVNDDVPGVEVVARPVIEEWEVTKAPKTTFGHLEVGDESVLSKYGDYLWYPQMNTGDALVFGERTLHRSYGAPHSRGIRTSIDLRVLSLRKYPKVLNGQIGIRLSDLKRIDL